MKDPIRFDGGVNLYAYVFNDPVNYVDPLGLAGEKGKQGGGPLKGNDPGVSRIREARNAFDAANASGNGPATDSARRALESAADDAVRTAAEEGTSKARAKALRAAAKVGKRAVQFGSGLGLLLELLNAGPAGAEDGADMIPPVPPKPEDCP